MVGGEGALVPSCMALVIPAMGGDCLVCAACCVVCGVVCPWAGLWTSRASVVWLGRRLWACGFGCGAICLVVGGAA